MAQRVSFSNWPGLKPGVDGAPRKNCLAESLLLDRFFWLLLLVVEEEVVVGSGLVFSGTT